MPGCPAAPTLTSPPRRAAPRPAGPPQVSADALHQLLAALTCLSSLDIQKNWDFTDEALRRALPLMSGLQALDLRGTWVSRAACRAARAGGLCGRAAHARRLRRMASGWRW
jgi:hypothetical protein